VIVPPELRESIIASEASFCREIPRWDPTAAIDSLIDGAGATYEFLRPFLSGGERILEIGAGNGFGLCDLLLRGLDVTGVEPGRSVSFEGRYDRACALLEANGFGRERLIPGCGEAVPMADGTFDVVFTKAVLEHVTDPKAVLREAVRVTRRGGIVLMDVPNYHAWYEWHYDMFWPMFTRSRALAKMYVRLRGRPDYYIDQLNFTTPLLIRRALPGVSVTVYPFALPPFRKVTSLTYALGTGRWPTLTKTARSVLGSVSGWCGSALERAGWCPSFTAVIRP
jgi:SAM-dependent methyltransferase